ncbi:MAG: quinolinate synthase NadA [Clostridia bacterium]|nr:quinolinate synthase NadA [Clostridia bacterium]
MNDSCLQSLGVLKKQRNALILAHYYQNGEIQEIADYVGDSLALSRLAAEAPEEVIVFCGVHFMAKSAALLSPEKTVLLPAAGAGCPLADMATPEMVREWRRKYPRAAVVAYINSSAAIKAESDICCTSANAVQVIRSLPEKEIIFLPDQNLGAYAASQVPEKTIHLWPGYCPVHHNIEVHEVLAAKNLAPASEVEVLAHPECRPAVLAHADFVGSTARIIEQVGRSKARHFVILTEKGVLHELKKRYPEKHFYFPARDLGCQDMKKTSLQQVITALQEMEPVVSVAEPVRSRARRALERMLSL